MTAETVVDKLLEADIDPEKFVKNWLDVQPKWKFEPRPNIDGWFKAFRHDGVKWTEIGDVAYHPDKGHFPWSVLVKGRGRSAVKNKADYVYPTQKEAGRKLWRIYKAWNHIK